MGFSSSVGFFLALTIALSMILEIQTAAAQCRGTDTERSFSITRGPFNCQRCRDGCKARCDAMRAIRGSGNCRRRFVIQTDVTIGLKCGCCCRRVRTPPRPRPPPPPLALFGPPPPLPDLFGPPPPLLDLFGPPSPLPDLFTPPLPTCSLIPFDFDGCIACATECETKCSLLGTSVAAERCIRRGSSIRECECCCEDNTSPPQPLPAPAPAPLALPPSSTPPPPPNTKCAAGEEYISIQFSNDTSCTTCATDCLRRCSASLDIPSLSSQSCKVDASSSSEFCECCCTAEETN
ncbi:hypothetical protein C5167_030593 [Papaver somniferum]|uniref:uncharacterized protein LOC113329118 n=1 Tax=Papaver somniferum TaxID=3469 RepID=UPI000E6FB366|nr:uncharacterized protein LOC113329118 [Papaver somniferum]RZC86514.1 hypothetical protein C5167_030593 [Papaver somniferum]